MDNKEFRTVVVRGIPDAVHKVLRIMAAEEDVSVNALIVSILIDEAKREALGDD